MQSLKNRYDSKLKVAKHEAVFKAVGIVIPGRKFSVFDSEGH